MWWTHVPSAVAPAEVYGSLGLDLWFLHTVSGGDVWGVLKCENFFGDTPTPYLKIPPGPFAAAEAYAPSGPPL